jgi:hypothetical protein
MWNKAKRERYDELRREGALRALTDRERADLAALKAELDAEEARAMKPALDRLAREADELRAAKAEADARAGALERIVEQDQKLLAEARAYADRLRERRDALREEFDRLRSGALYAAR